MSGYGWNSGYGNINGGFNRALPSYPSHFQEHCVICNYVFFSSEALINHYEAHMRDDELASRAMREGNLPPNLFQTHPFNPLNAPTPSSTPQELLQTNYVRIQNQAPLSQRNVALGASQLLSPQSIPPPQAPPITRSTQTIIQQQRQQHAIRPTVQRANLVPPNVNVRPRASVSQLNQPVGTPDEIELDFDDEDKSSPHGSINLDLTLSL